MLNLIECVCIDLYYSHMPIGKVWNISVTVCLCVFVRLRISPPRIKLVASNFAQRFIGVQDRKSQIFVNFASLGAENRTAYPSWHAADSVKVLKDNYFTDLIHWKLTHSLTPLLHTQLMPFFPMSLQHRCPRQNTCVKLLIWYSDVVENIYPYQRLCRTFATLGKFSNCISCYVCGWLL